MIKIKCKNLHERIFWYRSEVMKAARTMSSQINIAQQEH